jgi:hypothetical protein
MSIRIGCLKRNRGRATVGVIARRELWRGPDTHDACNLPPTLDVLAYPLRTDALVLRYGLDWCEVRMDRPAATKVEYWLVGATMGVASGASRYLLSETPRRT